MKTKFPIEVWRGSILIRIYRQKKAGVFTVVHYEGTLRKRVSFSDLADAREEAESVADRLSCHDGGRLLLKGTDLAEYATAREYLNQSGTRLDLAASEYSQAISILNGRGTLLEAVRYFNTSNMAEIIPIRTDTLVGELLKAREANRSSKRHLQDLKSRLNRFAQAFVCEVHTIRPGQVQDFLLALKLSPRSMNNFRMAISNLFSHAKLRGHAPKDFDPLEKIPWSKETDGEVEICSPDELKTIFAHARNEMIPYLAIAAFAGLRQAEIVRLDWNEVKEDYILVMGGISKTKTRRQAPLLPNLADWLRPFRQKNGPVVPLANVTNALGRLATDAKITWKRNGLRHSFGSFRLALEKDPPSVAYEMGNSTAMVFKHYRKVVTEAEATRWFAMYPDCNRNPVFRLATKPGLDLAAAAA